MPYARRAIGGFAITAPAGTVSSRHESSILPMSNVVESSAEAFTTCFKGSKGGSSI